MDDPLASWEIFKGGVTLLAFVLAFYGLVAKERKTPYMVFSVYKVSFVILISLTLCAIFPFTQDSETLKKTGCILKWMAAALLVASLVYVIYRLLKEYNRHAHFRDDNLIQNLSVYRAIKGFKRRNFGKKKPYQHNPMVLPPNLIDELKKSAYLPAESLNKALAHHEKTPTLSIAASLELNSSISIDQALSDIAISFLRNGCFVQYTCCSRHPLEWLAQLKQRWEAISGNSTWNKVSSRVVLVDAYTPHFGFTDSIYDARAHQDREDCLKIIKAKQTYAGVHTAITKAFNAIRKHDPETLKRSPTLVIYEGCQALADLESHEQYRIFLRHVIPSERLWGGMFTLFVESSLTADNEAVLRGLAHVFVKEKDLTDAATQASQ